MRFPLALHTSLLSSLAKNMVKRQKKFPLVLMLEPTHRCNLACAGCDRVRLYELQKTEDLSLTQCIDAAVESQAPVVTVTGGEPMLYRDLMPLVKELIRMKRFVYLCTNGLLAEEFIGTFKPHSRLTLNFHLDGMRETHDVLAGREGTFDTAINAITSAKKRGFRVSTNTSVYKNTEVRELEQLFAFLGKTGVDGFLISPAYGYDRVRDDIFLSRKGTKKRFRQLAKLFTRYPFMNSPVYLDFLMGKRHMRCTPWGNPTRNPFGWKSPCYLITDTYSPTYRELIEKTPWEHYGNGGDPRCTQCMVHSGYEATVVRNAFTNPADLMRLLIWNLKKN